MKKVGKVSVISALLTAGLFSFNLTSTKAAVVGEFGGSASSGCTQTNYGQICNNNILKEYYVNVSFSKSEVASTVSKYNTWSSTKQGTAAQFVLTLSALGTWGVFAANLGYIDVISKFQTAKSKGTGLNWTYKVTLYKTTNITKVSNVTWKYK